jgi:uncharacterized OsmC-like protein
MTLSLSAPAMVRATFMGSAGTELAARLELPEHCMDCGAAAEGREGKRDRFQRIISIEGEMDGALPDKLVEIAGKCPVHPTLETASAVVTTVEPNA